jgi:hypothetical protein
MNSIGSAHAVYPATRAFSPVSTPDRMLSLTANTMGLPTIRREFIQNASIASLTFQFYREAIGSIPLLPMASAADGDARNLINAIAELCSLERAATPAENTVILCTSGGSAPT